MTATVRQYGTWNSPISPAMLAGSMRFYDVQWSRDGETLVWLERRSQGGVLVAKTGNTAQRDLTGEEMSVSGGVGYGGGEFTVGDEWVYFASKGRLYRIALAYGLPETITPDYGSAASPALSADGKWLAYVHSDEGDDSVLLVDVAGELLPRRLCGGDDFYMQPVWHPQGTHMACIAWNHPQMPWNGTELRLMTMAYDTPGVPYAAIIETLAGDPETAIFQPEFSPDGRYLAYISDADGFSHLYVYDLGEGTHTQITSGDFEVGYPAWVQGLRQYGWSADSNAIYYLHNAQAQVSLHRHDVQQATDTAINTQPYTHLHQISVSPSADRVALLASSDRIPSRVIVHETDTETAIIRRATGERLNPAHLAPAEHITWSGHDNEPVHGLYYAPISPDTAGTGKPPLMVLVHGGPTSQRYASFDMEVQFFTTRGYAVLQVNHRGSTGYGKAYMNKHAGNWGVYDVEDSATGAQHLVDEGKVDPDKLVIMGGSAGGYTVLLSLIRKPGFYKAGICSYGVANLFGLAMETHKFESRYNDWLLGPLPEAAATWRERSPIFHADKIQDALLVFQGTEDKVVPQNQSDAIVAALRRSGVPHDYHVYEGEGHGWRKPETKTDFYNRILTFLMQYVLYG